MINKKEILDTAKKGWPLGWDLEKHCHAVFLVGSRGWGYAKDESDYDVVLLVVPPAEEVLGFKPFESVRFEYENSQVNVWSLKRFTRLLENNDPITMEWLLLGEDMVYYSAFAKYLKRYKSELRNLRTVRVFLAAAQEDFLKSIDGAEDVYNVKTASHIMRRLFLAVNILQEENPTSSMNVNMTKIVSEIRESGYTLESFKTLYQYARTNINELIQESFLKKEPNTSSLEKSMIESMRALL